MDKTLEQVCNALEEIGNSIKSRDNNTQTLNEQHGGYSPALSFDELAEIAYLLAERIQAANISKIEGELAKSLTDVPHKLQLLQSKTVPHFSSGNNPPVSAYVTTIQWIESKVQPLLHFGSLPTDLIYLEKEKQKIADLSSQSGADSSAIAKLKDASTRRVASIKQKTQQVDEHINEKIQKADEFINESIEQMGERIKEKIKQSDKDIKEKTLEVGGLIKKCKKAERITTTKGLAGAFDERAKNLSESMLVWVKGLLAALLFGVLFGTLRVNFLIKTMNDTTVDTRIIIIQSIVSVLSFGAPLWFAWLATKQIGHRFKLAEDYAFKASVAKAYEGYRTEAARIDEAFEARLFSTILTRVEEHPLRLVGDSSHGSPWHELVTSPEFRSAIDNIPELRKKFIELAKQGMDSVKDIKPSKKDKPAKKETGKEEDV